jgi:hypothetical protein
LVAPWKVFEFHGGEALMAALKVHLARDWCSGAKVLPVLHARRLQADLAGRIANLQALHDEIKEYPDRIDRRRAMRSAEAPLTRWPAEQAAKKASKAAAEKQSH